MRVLLTGTYSSWNKGDAAMELATATALRDHQPALDVVISSPFPEHDRDAYAGIPVVACSRRRLVSSTISVLAALAWWCVRRLSGRSLDWLLVSEELRTYRGADLVVDLSGDMLTDDYGPHVAYSHFLPLIHSILLETPYVLCAQSIGPFRLTRPLARFLLAKARWISVREEISYQYVLGLGIRTPLHRTADMAFLLKAAPTDHHDVSGSGGTTARTTPPVLGVSVSALVARKYGRSVGSVGMSEFESLVASVLDSVVEQLGMRILFVPHVTGPAEDKDDRVIGERVRARMRQPSCAVRDDLDPRTLKHIIARCHMFLGARMHANIAALDSGVPVVALSYSHKTDGIMARFDQVDCVHRADALDAALLLASLRAVAESREDRASQILSHRASVQADAARNIEMIGETLANVGRTRSSA